MVVQVFHKATCRECKDDGVLCVLCSCMRASLSTITGEAFADVPHFLGNSQHRYCEILKAWLKELGLGFREVALERLPKGPAIVIGKSPDGYWHAAAWEGGPKGKIASDPNRTNGGLVREPRFFGVLAPRKAPTKATPLRQKPATKSAKGARPRRAKGKKK